jgi:hypothetical protein
VALVFPWPVPQIPARPCLHKGVPTVNDTFRYTGRYRRLGRTGHLWSSQLTTCLRKCESGQREQRGSADGSLGVLKGPSVASPPCAGTALCPARTNEGSPARWLLPSNQWRILHRGESMRDRTSACCLRIASVKTSRPNIESLLFSSTKPRQRRPSTTAGRSFRVVPPPNNLISSRCCDLVNSSQPAVSAMADARSRFSNHLEPRSAKVNDQLRGAAGGRSWLHLDERLFANARSPRGCRILSRVSVEAQKEGFRRGLRLCSSI